MGVLVVITSEQDRDAFVAALTAAGLAFDEFDNLPQHFHVRAVDVESLPDLPGVASVEPDDTPVSLAAPQALTVAKDFSGANWGLARIIRRKAPWWKRQLDASLPLATSYDCFRDGTGVDVYLFDSGTRLAHEQFGGRATNVYEYFSSLGTGDDFGHGTQCAALAGGATVGPARGALLWSFKCVNSGGGADVTSITTAINQAISHYNGRSGTNRPAVANFSLALASTSVATAVAALIDAGIVVCAAAANNLADLATIDVYPAEAADTICCGGIGPADIPYFATADGSNYGTRIDVSAPAQCIYTATNTSNAAYLVHRGTSYASPLTAGAVACVLQGHGRLTGRSQVQQVRQHIINTATTGELTNPAGWGITLPDRILYLDPSETFTPLVLS